MLGQRLDRVGVVGIGVGVAGPDDDAAAAGSRARRAAAWRSPAPARPGRARSGTAASRADVRLLADVLLDEHGGQRPEALGGSSPARGGNAFPPRGASPHSATASASVTRRNQVRSLGASQTYSMRLLRPLGLGLRGACSCRELRMARRAAQTGRGCTTQYRGDGWRRNGTATAATRSTT